MAEEPTEGDSGVDPDNKPLEQQLLTEIYNLQKLQKAQLAYLRSIESLLLQQRWLNAQNNVEESSGSSKKKRNPPRNSGPPRNN